jgi:chemotaxis protein CheZ
MTGERPVSSPAPGAPVRDPRIAARVEQGDLTPSDIKIYGELDSLAQYIAQAKAEIDAIRPEDISDRHIPLANGELDAIGAHLEQATGTILDCCEQIERVAGELDCSGGTILADCVTRIYEACNFQDLTGQRITKIIATLQAIEQRIGLLLRAFGGPSKDRAQEPSQVHEERAGDARLLNGPQHPATSSSQAEIDALFAALA